MLSRDTTESDLKQRREIVGGSLEWVDQPPVRAAREGRVLILDGLEKAERNVLPTLNNLLENREMALQDGSFLTSTERFDALRESGAAQSTQLVRVHEARAKRRETGPAFHYKADTDFCCRRRNGRS